MTLLADEMIVAIYDRLFDSHFNVKLYTYLFDLTKTTDPDPTLGYFQIIYRALCEYKNQVLKLQTETLPPARRTKFSIWGYKV